MAEPRAFTLPPGGGSAITLPVAIGSKPGGGIPHTFQNVGDGLGKLLIISAPSGLEDFFVEYTRRVAEGPVDVEGLAAAAHISGVEFVGPPLAVSDPS